MQNVFAINGRYYDVKILEVLRNYQVLDNDDNAGRTADGTMVRDVIGTYYNYTVRIDPSQTARGEYDDLYDLISSPIDYIQLTILVGRHQQTFDAYVTKGQDKIIYVNNVPKWTALSLNFVAMEPQRRPA